MIAELHAGNVPQIGYVRQPRFGERQAGSYPAIFPIMGNRLKQLREEKKWTQQHAADAFGVSKSHYIKLERGERQLTEAYIQRAANVYAVHPANVISDPVDTSRYGDDVPIVGLAGAGPDGAVLFGRTDGELGFGNAAPNSSQTTVALEVSGDSMRGIASDGWLVYYDGDQQEAPTDDMLGELCVVGLEDDRVLVKVLQPGRGIGLYDLESFNAPVMRDIAVRWASLVTTIIPRKPARRLLKRKG